MTSETKKLLLGAYGKLPGNANKELLDLASKNPPEIEIDKNLDEIKVELKSLCQDGDLPDLSKDLENLLTYILFPNVAINFFKGRSF